MNPATFSHLPLDPRRRQIRLVTIDRRKRDSKDVHLHLKVHNADTVIKPSYCAVSYTWGPENGLREIYINDKKFSVRSNLFALLSQLKAHPTFLRQWFWIDQICVDQSNLNERNDVVGRMSDIYSSAKEVVVWLGESNSDLDYVFDVFAGKMHFDYSSPGLQKIEKATAAFCSRDYWGRLWIVQEMLLAQKVSYWCGAKAIGQKSMAKNSKSYTIRGGGDYQLPWSLIDKACSGPQEWDWKMLLLRFGSQKCADPLDRVYGLLGIVQPQFRVTVDYSTSKAKLVVAVLLKCIDEWFMKHQQLNPGNVMRENFDTAIKLVDAIYGDAYHLAALTVLQAVVWSACLFQYCSRVSQPGDKWLNFWSFLGEARIPAHRLLAESIRDGLLRNEIAARNWVSWYHLDKTQQASIKFADYEGARAMAAKKMITFGIRKSNYKSMDGYFVQKDAVDLVEALEAAAKDGTLDCRLVGDLPPDFLKTLQTRRSDESKKDLFAIRFLDDPYERSLPTWNIQSDTWSSDL